VQDKDQKTQFEVTNDGTVTLGNDTASKGGKLTVQQGLDEDNTLVKIEVKDKYGQTKFKVMSDGALIIGGN
jgi:hypothetical protein